MIKNNVTRFLTSKKVEFEGFELPKEKLGAAEAAEMMAVNPSLAYKTIVIERIGKGKPILAVIPGNHQVNLKNTAKLLNEKKVALPTEAIAEKLTGLQAGGISPFALMNKVFRFYYPPKLNSTNIFTFPAVNADLIFDLKQKTSSKCSAQN